MSWIKCNKRHARSDEYDYFIQGGQNKGWTGVHQARFRKLKKRFGKSTICEKHINEDGEHVYRHTPNKNWYIDRKRHRIYITKDALLIHGLTYAE